MKFIYVIRGREDGINLGYVTTREEAEKICNELPDVFMYEPLSCLEGEVK
jgi:hypothetical protein